MAPEWVPKSDAARFLGVSPRQIERRAAAGMIRSRRESRRPDQTAAPVLFSREDLLAIKAGAPNYHPVVEPATPASESKLAVLPAPAAGLERLAQLLGPAPAAPKPWLTLDEAAEYSGLPVRWLRSAASEGRIVAVNVGLKRPRWLVSRDALAAWRP